MKRMVERTGSYVVRAAVAGTLAFGAIATSAMSAEAQSRLNFEGAANLFDAPGSGGSLLFIDFLVNGETGGTPVGTVRATETISGDFSAISPNDVGTITDLTIGPAGVVGAPVNPFLTFGSFTFLLASTPAAAPGPFNFGPITLVGTPTGSVGFFGVRGTVTGGAFGATGREFQGLFTAQFAGRTPEQVFGSVNSGGTLPVSFSAEFQAMDATVIPEPSTYVLLATGLASLMSVTHFRRRRSEENEEA